MRKREDRQLWTQWQRTPHSFLQQLAAPAVALLVSKPPVVPANIPNYDISGAIPKTSPEASATTASSSDPMLVVGECPGDKRKSEFLQQDSARADEVPGEAEGSASGAAPMEIGLGQPQPQQLGTPLQPIRVAYQAFIPQSREDLLEPLKSRNKEQAFERKARTEAQHQKSCPY